MSKKCVIGSVLKPVDDVRHFRKIALSISGHFNWDIDIIGFHGAEREKPGHIRFYPIYNFNRWSIRRLFAPCLFFIYLLKLRPHYIICCTHELLWPSVVYKLIFWPKLIYDVQENYYRNHWYGSTESHLISWFIASYIRLKEYMCAPFVNLFILAEKVYEEQLGFVKKHKKIIVENKSVLANEEHDSEDEMSYMVCIAGTLGKEYGTIEGVSFFKKLQSSNPELKLSVVGSCKDHNYYLKLIDTLKGIEHCDYEITSGVLDFEIINRKVKQSGVVLLPYRFSKATSGRFPTKLFDLLVLGKKAIIQHEQELERRLRKYPNIYFTDFYSRSRSTEDLKPVKSFLERPVQQTKEYEIFQWEGEEQKLIKALSEL